MKTNWYALESKLRTNVYLFYSFNFFLISVSVVAVFFSCYAPYQIQRLIFFYINNDSGLHAEINEYLYIISGNNYTMRVMILLFALIKHIDVFCARMFSRFASIYNLY